jgi:hypothetical protein
MRCSLVDGKSPHAGRLYPKNNVESVFGLARCLSAVGSLFSRKISSFVVTSPSLLNESTLPDVAACGFEGGRVDSSADA